jgi:hypothetical protein
VLRFVDQSGEAGEWRNQVMQRYPESSTTDAPDLTALGQPAVALDLQWKRDSALRSGRFARVPLSTGFVEFSLITLSESFDQYLAPLTHLMLSLRSTAPGGQVVSRPRERE